MLIICILWTMYRIEQEVYFSSENYGKYNQIIFERSLTYFITLFQIRETVFGIILYRHFVYVLRAKHTRKGEIIYACYLFAIFFMCRSEGEIYFFSENCYRLSYNQ